MREMNQEQLESLRAQFPQGTRIQCVENKDGVSVSTGEKGTLEHIDEAGLFHCDLDDGRRFIAAIDEGCFQVIPPKQTERCRITEITKDTFWTLIDQAKEHTGGPSEWLMEQLVDMGTEQAKRFDTIARVYMDAAYRATCSATSL